MDEVRPVLTAEEIVSIQKKVNEIHTDSSVYDYIVALSEATRKDERLSLGLSPRGSIALYKVSCALAYMSERDYVTPYDINAAWMRVASHRVRISARGRSLGLTSDEVLDQIFRSVPVPKVG